MLPDNTDYTFEHSVKERGRKFQICYMYEELHTECWKLELIFGGLLEFGPIRRLTDTTTNSLNFQLCLALCCPYKSTNVSFSTVLPCFEWHKYYQNLNKQEYSCSKVRLDSNDPNKINWKHGVSFRAFFLFGKVTVGFTFQSKIDYFSFRR